VPFYEDSHKNTCNKDAAIAIHCKAGKGRTGLMVICFLLFSEHQFSDQTNFPMNAMHYYNAKRTMNKKGLTIASQIRYVQVFYKFL
jgi:phosphatidylinositol-3,4,5-trisphosphate 3-phosphatase/dual-specificity protein phosphatase PTEN